ncbi:MAG TPA: hypothetical protein PKI14_01565 [Fervidobacterium sp.]|mgnify:CR=1 FL=1|nr:hypothetical protein [Fervidobacterium sp.]
MNPSNFTVVIDGKEYDKKDLDEAVEFLALAVLNGDVSDESQVIIKIKDVNYV